MSLQKMRPFLTNDICCHVYKQTILPVMDYADYIVDSAPKNRVSRLQNLQTKAIKLIDNQKHNKLSVDELHTLYNLKKLKSRRDEHILCVMYAHSKVKTNLTKPVEGMVLRNSNKVKFYCKKTDFTKVQQSPFYRGMSLWNQLSESTQKLLTKVKFKQNLAKSNFG